MIFNPKRRPRVLVYTRQGCENCNEALDLLYRQSRRRSICVDIVDVDRSPELRDRHGSEVPVVFIDGVKCFDGSIDPVQLRRALEA